jgi:hypothetical protein
MTAPGLGSNARRLIARYAPDAWIGFVVRAIPAGAYEHDGAITHTPDHYVGAVWLPPGEALQRWPEAVVIGSPRADNAIAQLLEQVPATARLYLAHADEVDAALAVAILRASDRNLEAYQRAALDRYIEAERARQQKLIEERYTDRDPGYERFRTSVVTPSPDRPPDA